MFSFGTSAFLKIVSLSYRQQVTELRRRNGSGYDFHRSLRERVRRHLVQGTTIKTLLSVNDIKKEAEKNSVRRGLKAFEKWRAQNTGTTCIFDAVTYQHPSQLFKVQYTPTFGVEQGDKHIAVHVWNTAKPALDPRFAKGVLSLFPSLYSGKKPDALSILDLTSGQLHVLDDVDRYTNLGLLLCEALDQALKDILTNGGVPTDVEAPAPGPIPN